MKLRDYQHNLVDDVRAAFMTSRSVLMQLGTGGGKTQTAGAIIRLAISKGRRVVFATHLGAIIDDVDERLTSLGIEHGVIQANRRRDMVCPVQVCSLATLHRRDEAPPADLVIIDECHRAAAPSVRSVLDAYPTAHILGLTATPERGDATPLGDVFERMVCGPSVKDLTAHGHLVPAHVFSPMAPLEGGLAEDPAIALAKHAPGQPAMVFCRDADHAADVASRIPNAVAILGDTPRAARIDARKRLADGAPVVLVGCGVFIEGWDSPEVRVVVLGRTMGTTGTYLQAVGRALRPVAGKTHATILDLSGAAIVHGLPEDERVWSLTGDAVKRVGEDLKNALSRCRQCFAVFHAGPSECPRCGERVYGGKVKRRATRIERQELSRLDKRPQEVRDTIAIRGIEKRLRMSGRFPEAQIPRIAQSIFRKQRGRSAA